MEAKDFLWTFRKKQLINYKKSEIMKRKKKMIILKMNLWILQATQMRNGKSS